MDLFEIFKPFPELVAGFSTKQHGSLRLGSSDSGLMARREAFLKELGVAPDRTVSAGLIHSMHATPVNWAEAGNVVAETDGLLTREPDLYLSVTAGDCLPIFLYDPANRISGLLHAGWHGLTIGMVPSAMAQFVAMEGDTRQLRVGIGPAIGACHFEIHPNLAERFEEYPETVEDRDGKLFVDLKGIARTQFANLGVPQEQIEVRPECTYCLEQTYFSNRRDKPKEIEAMMAVIGARAQ